MVRKRVKTRRQIYMQNFASSNTYMPIQGKNYITIIFGAEWLQNNIHQR